MTLSEADVEARLRDVRTRADAVPPPPPDLAETVRARYGAERGRRLRLAGACVALGLLFVAVAPRLGPGPGQDERGAVAPAPAETTGEPALLDVPTRGSLARASGWLADVAALDWGG